MTNAAAVAVSDTRTHALVAGRLNAAREAVEGRFLEAGEVLGQTVEGLGRLIASLDQLGGALDADTVAATTSELQAAAASLLELPTRHADRRGAIERLTRVGERLALGIEDIRRNLAYLRVFSINIKITAGGIAAAGEEFGAFAQEISDCIELGRGQIDAFDAELQTLRGIFRTALAHELGLAAQCDSVLPVVPEGLIANASAMVVHHQRIARVIDEVGALARGVQKKVGAALGALQIGDITRQRIEHVSLALDLLAATSGITPDQRARLFSFVYGLLATQLRSTAGDFQRDVARMGIAMDGIAGDASEILRLRELAFGRAETDEDSFLRRLETNVAHALTLVEQMSAADRRALQVEHSATTAAAGLGERITTLADIKTNVQHMALNTTLKCSRIGEVGRPLAVIAIELRAHAGYMETSSGEVMAALAGLSDDAGQQADGGPPASGGESLTGDVGEALSRVAQRLRLAGDKVEADLSALARQGEVVVDALRGAAGRLNFQREIGAILDETADALADCAGDDTPVTDDLEGPLGALLAAMSKSYTMAQERETHRAFTAGLAFQAPAPTATPAAAELEDVLF